MKRVKGSAHLVKDPSTGVVSNINLSDLDRAKKARKRILEEIEEKNGLKERVEKVEALLQELLDKQAKPKPQRKRTTTTKKEDSKDE